MYVLTKAKACMKSFKYINKINKVNIKTNIKTFISFTYKQASQAFKKKGGFKTFLNEQIVRKLSKSLFLILFLNFFQNFYLTTIFV